MSTVAAPLSVPAWWPTLALDLAEAEPATQHMAIGVAGALRALILEHADPADWVPPLLDEYRSPLCAAHLGLPLLLSILWGAGHPTLQPLPSVPRLSTVVATVHMLVLNLDMSHHDLVTAVLALERIGQHRRGLFTARALRRTFLGCCLIARKFNSDAHITLRWAHSRLENVCTALSLRELARLERQVFVLLCESGCLPMDGLVYRTYASALWGVANQAAGKNWALPEMFIAME